MEGSGGKSRVSPASGPPPAGGAALRLLGRAARPAQSPPSSREPLRWYPAPGGAVAGKGNGGSPEPRGRRSLPVAGQGGPVPSRGALSPLSPLPSSRRLVTLARGLAPAFLRFAGKRTDFLQFHNVKNPAKSRGGPGPDYYLKNYEDGELRGRDGGRARQRGAARTGRSRFACPALPAPGRGRAVLPPGTGQGTLPPTLSFPSRGARRSPPARCRWIRWMPTPGNKRPAPGSGACRIPPAAPPRPPVPFAPKPRAGSGGRRGGFAPAAGGDRVPHPRDA